MLAVAVQFGQHGRGGAPNMKYGAQNRVQAKVKSIKKGDIMSLVKFEVVAPATMASVLTTESLDGLDIKVGDKIELIVKAIHVLPVKE
jgi:molybdate transport system regulatory protein